MPKIKLPQNSKTTVMLTWLLKKQAKKFILQFSINGSFFSGTKSLQCTAYIILFT